MGLLTWGFLKKLFPYRIIDTNIQHERVIRNPSDGRTQVDEVVHGVMQYDPDTGELIPFGTWTQPQVFENTAEFQDDVEFQNPVVFLEETDHQAGLQVSQGQHITLDNDEDSYLVAINDLRWDFVIDGWRRITLTSGQVVFLVAEEHLSYARFRSIVKPTQVVNYAHLYCKLVGGKGHMFAMDEDGNEFDLTV